MKPSDIEVGATYKHADYPGTVYLGCGYRGKRWLGPFTKKFLTIIDDPFPDSYVGTAVIGVKGAGQQFWDGFRKLSSRHA